MNLHTAFLFFSVLCCIGITHCRSQNMSERASWTQEYTFSFIKYNRYFSTIINITPKTTETRISIPCLNVERQLLNITGQSFNVTRRPRCETVQIFSTADINVHGMMFSSVGLTAGFLALPHEQLGKEYLVDCYTPINRSAQVAIAAIFDNTTITIYCADNCTFENARVSGEIKLGAGESGILTGVKNETEMTGTYIRSDEPISVIVGALSVYIPRDNLDKGHGVILEQLLPIPSWGIDHIVPPFQQTPNGWILRILAMNESTIISTTDCGEEAPSSQTLESKDYMDITVKGTSQNLCLIQANKPIQVMQYVAGSHKNRDDGDPSMTIIPAVKNYLGNTTVCVNKTTSGMRYFGDIVVMGEETPMLHFKGSLVPEMNRTCYNISSRPIEGSESYTT
ncbi:IgGFc-binding protein-like [Strongylocentrotus purpuratus]|uniref:IgGFc-binding protein N-terminal domain-containing protein n=1 Tax=Strongylocentrotus purpuratus TaxID=7668 RepID=A0A7M7T047_STRPU|nr:IgGFc-binding protein-like [Strongylocentrotus purpuratus]